MEEKTWQDLPKGYEYFSNESFRAQMSALSDMTMLTLNVLRPPVLAIACVFVDIIRSQPELEKMVRDFLNGKPVSQVIDENAIRIPKPQADA